MKFVISDEVNLGPNSFCVLVLFDIPNDVNLQLSKQFLNSFTFICAVKCVAIAHKHVHTD